MTMDPDTLESLIASLSYLGIFLLMISNGALSFPSSQILYIIVGYFVATGTLQIIPSSLIGALGNTIGNIVLYEGIRMHGVRYIERWGLFRKEDIKKVEILFRKGGTWFLFVGKLLPAIKVFVPIPAALGKVDRRVFALIMFSASWIWSLAFIAIGLLFGKGAMMWKSYGIILVVIAFILAIIFYRMLNSKSVLEELERGG
jgi:membrane protein DedA with SNARE-associated domain